MASENEETLIKAASEDVKEEVAVAEQLPESQEPADASSEAIAPLEDLQISKPESADLDSDSDESFGYDPEQKFQNDTIEEISQLAKHMQQTYLEAAQEYKELQSLIPKFKSLAEKSAELSQYYYYGGPYQHHRDRLEKERPEEKLDILDDDTIYSFVYKYEEMAKSLLREVVLDVTKDQA